MSETDNAMFPQPYFNDDIIHRINDVNVMLQKLFHAFYTPYGLTFVQVPVLMALRRHGKMRVSELGQALEIGSSNITPLCKWLEKANLVTRTRSNEDQRVVYVDITPYAEDILSKIEQEINAKAPEANEMTVADTDAILNGLNILYRNLCDLGNLSIDDRRRF